MDRETLLLLWGRAWRALLAPDDDGGSGGGAGGSGDGAAGGTGSSSAGGTGTGAGSTTSTGPSLDDIRAELSKVREEAASYRKRAKAAEEQLEAARKGSMSELERAQETAREAERRLAENEARTKKLLTRLSVQAKATSMGIVDPDAAAQLLPESDLVLGDDGAPTAASLDAALKKLVKEKPWLTRGGPGDTGGGDNDDRRAGDMNTNIRRLAGYR